MSLLKIYELGKKLNLGLSFQSAEKKLKFVFFPYSASAVISTSLIFILMGLFFGFFLRIFSEFLSTSSIFLFLIIGVVCYIYPTSIYYTNKLMEYSEEM